MENGDSHVTGTGAVVLYYIILAEEHKILVHDPL